MDVAWLELVEEYILELCPPPLQGADCYLELPQFEANDSGEYKTLAPLENTGTKRILNHNQPWG